MSADDSALIITHANFDTLLKEANIGPASYSMRFKLSKSSLSVKKSNCMIFSSKKLYPKDSFRMVIESTEMTQGSSTRFSGVIVGENLSWREQVDWVSKKVNKSIGIIRKISHLVSLNALLILYYSLIYPHRSYS